MHAAEAESEIVHVAAQHAPDGAALGAAPQGLHGRGLLAVVAGGGVARQHNAVGREIGGEAPGVLAFAGDHLAGILRRPADLGRLAHLGAQLAGEIQVRAEDQRRHKGLERGRADIPQGGVALAPQLFVEALTNDGPIAEVVGDGPDQLDAFSAELGNLRGGGGEKGFGGLANAPGQHHQELAAAAGTQQDARQPKLGQQGAGQHFAEQSNPLGLAGQQVFAGGTHGPSLGGTRQEKLFRAQDFALQ